MSGQLSRSRILEVAFDLVAEVGHDRLSMRLLAQRLRVDPMAAYHYFPNKSALLDGVVERAWQLAMPERFFDESNYRRALIDVFVDLYHGLVARPRLLPLVATRSVATPAMLELLEAAVRVLVKDNQISAGDALAMVNMLAALTMGAALADGAPAVGGQEAKDVLAVAAQYPMLYSAVASHQHIRTVSLRQALTGIVEHWLAH